MFKGKAPWYLLLRTTVNKKGQSQEIIQRIIVFSHRGQIDRLVFIIFGSAESSIRFAVQVVLDIHCTRKNKDA